MRNAQFVGRITRDPKFGKNSAPISIAVNESFKNKESGEYEDRTYFVTAWADGKTGEYADRNITKGDLVSVEARVGTKTNDQGHTEGYDFSVVNLKRIHKAQRAESVSTDDVPF